ncbi:MAG: hypothetical protein PHX58_11595 [Desulfovibrio sp.]|jgi:hypothetical protein|nr:hypothetical protein [Desulfovibrio sp.]
MSTVIPQSEMCRKAMAWVEEQLRETGKPLAVLLEEAAMRFNLSPNECDFLQRFYSQDHE